MDALQYVVTFGGAVAVVLGWWKVVWPRLRSFTRKANSALDTLVGSDAITDPQTGRELRPAQPGAGVRLANVESALVQIGAAVTELSEIRNELVDHHRRIERLEASAIERIVTKAESASAWQAVAAAQQSDPTEEPS